MHNVVSWIIFLFVVALKVTRAILSCNVMSSLLNVRQLEFAKCTVYSNIFPLVTPITVPDPCSPSPCGPNADCLNGLCTCIAGYQGDPYIGCRPECVQNYDCPPDRSCVKNKCVNTCMNACGENAECSVINHIPMCSCIEGYTGNAFVLCSPLISMYL